MPKKIKAFCPKCKGGKHKKKIQLLGSGTILREALAAAELLEKDFKVAADVWSVTSFSELHREGVDTERWNMLHPDGEQRASYVEEQLADTTGPVVAVTDYVRTQSEQIRSFIKDRRYFTLGTDGFGRSDMRSQLRKFFEVNRYYVVVAALKALADDGVIEASVVADAIKKYKIDPEKPNPMTL